MMKQKRKKYKKSSKPCLDCGSLKNSHHDNGTAGYGEHLKICSGWRERDVKNTYPNGWPLKNRQEESGSDYLTVRGKDEKA